MTQTTIALPGTKRAVLYLRKSKKEDEERDTAHQRSRLEQVAARSGWEIIAIYEDDGISGAKGRDKRPAFDRMLKDATRRKFDVVMAFSVDRLGRSLAHLVTTLGDLHGAGVDLYLDQQAIDTTTPSGRAMFQMAGVFAEWERSMLIARVRSGMEHAKKHGTKSGQPIGRPQLNRKLVDKIQVAIESGMTTDDIYKTYHVGRSTVKRIRTGRHPALL